MQLLSTCSLAQLLESVKLTGWIPSGNKTVVYIAVRRRSVAHYTGCGRTGGRGIRHQRDADVARAALSASVRYDVSRKVPSEKASVCLYSTGVADVFLAMSIRAVAELSGPHPRRHPRLTPKLTTAITSSTQTMSDFEHPRTSETVNKEATTTIGGQTLTTASYVAFFIPLCTVTLFSSLYFSFIAVALSVLIRLFFPLSYSKDP